MVAVERLVFAALLAVVAVVGAGPAGTASHASWWKSTHATAATAQGTFPAFAEWSGRQAGNQGIVGLKIFLPESDVPVLQDRMLVREFLGRPDGAGIRFEGCTLITDPYIHEGVVPGQWALLGARRSDQCTALSDDRFQADHLGGQIKLVIESRGAIGVAHG